MPHLSHCLRCLRCAYLYTVSSAVFNWFTILLSLHTVSSAVSSWFTLLFSIFLSFFLFIPSPLRSSGNFFESSTNLLFILSPLRSSAGNLFESSTNFLLLTFSSTSLCHSYLLPFFEVLLLLTFFFYYYFFFFLLVLLAKCFRLVLLATCFRLCSWRDVSDWCSYYLLSSSSSSSSSSRHWTLLLLLLLLTFLAGKLSPLLKTCPTHFSLRALRYRIKSIVGSFVSS